MTLLIHNQWRMFHLQTSNYEDWNALSNLQKAFAGLKGFGTTTSPEQHKIFI